MSVPILPRDFHAARDLLFREPLRERSRIALAMSLRTLTATSEAISSAFEAEPDNDAEFDRLNVELALALQTASQCLDLWRHSRHCDGEA